MSAPERTSLVCEDLAHRFGDAGKGISGLSLTVVAGMLHAIRGANGAGKTTLISICAGNLKPAAGRVLICGHDVYRQPAEARRKFAFLPEAPRLYAHLSPVEHLLFFDRLVSIRRSRAELLESLQVVGLPLDVADRPLRTFSKGMRQRLAISISLSKGAGVFLLDEPTSGLDVTGSEEFGDLLLRLKQAGNAILLVSHDDALIAKCASSVSLLCEGRLEPI